MPSCAPPLPFSLLQGDCLAILPQVEANSAGAIITDPPYNSGGASSSSRCTQTPREKYQNSGTAREYPHFDGDQRDQRGYAFWCHLWLSECYRIAEDGAPILLFTDWRQLPLMTDILQSADFVWRGIVVWDKTSSCRPTRGRFATQSEYVVWGSKGKMASDRGPCLPGVFRHGVRQVDKHHVTGKPTPLMEDLVRIARPGSLIVDPFTGSGTTGVAALNQDRLFFGIEREESYFAIAKGRLEEAADRFSGQGRGAPA